MGKATQSQKLRSRMIDIAYVPLFIGNDNTGGYTLHDCPEKFFILYNLTPCLNQNVLYAVHHPIQFLFAKRHPVGGEVEGIVTVLHRIQQKQDILVELPVISEQSE